MRTIQITYTKNNVEREYYAEVNLNTMRNYSRKRGLKTLNDFLKDFSGFEAESTEDMTFDDLDKFALFFNEAFREGMRKRGESYDLDIDDIFDLFYTRQSELMGIVSLINDGLEDTGEAPAPVKGARKAKRSR